MSESDSKRIVEFIGVFDADGGIRGEAAYVVGKLLGTAHCGLCDITHTVRRKPAWDAMVEELHTPFTLVHRNERTPEMERATAGAEVLPAVLGRVGSTDPGLVYLLGPQSLDALGGSVDAFAARLREAVDEAGLSLDLATMSPGA